MSVADINRRGHLSSRWRGLLRRARRRHGKVLRWTALCVALIGVGLAVTSLTSTRVAEEPAFQPAAGRSEARGGADTKSESGGGGADDGSAKPESKSGAAAGGPETNTARDHAGDTDAKLITKGVTVQVLNGTRVGRADDRMLRRLLDLGYHVLAMHPSSVRYKETTVLWSRREGREAATALATRFGWGAERKPRNLSASVTFHVVVGRDEA